MRHDKDKYSQSKGIKPKNRVFCPDSQRPKMKFDTEEEALGFLKWNRSNFDDKIPSRIYWCDACCGYHITARPMGGVGVTIVMDLPYLTEALETDKHRVMTAVKMIHKVLYILKQPSGYFGKTGLGRCKSILDNLNYAKNPYYLEERERIYNIVEQKRAEYKDVWMKKKYCKLVKLKLYPYLCDINQDWQSALKRYNYNLAYILYLAENDGYNLNNLPELFLDEWETLFNASVINGHIADKMTPNKEDYGTDKDNQDEANLHEGETDVPGVQVSNQDKGL